MKKNNRSEKQDFPDGWFDPALLDAMSEGVFNFDPERKQILAVNRALVEMFEYPQEELITLDPGQLSLENEQQPPGSLASALSAPLSGATQEFSWQCRKKDGSAFPVRMRLCAGREKSVRSVICRDTTDHETSEALLRRSHQLETLGELSASIIHEIRQPLQVIKIITDSILYWYEEKTMSPEELHQNIGHLKKVSAATGRIETLISNIHQVLKNNGEEELHPLNLNQAVEGILPMYTQRLLNHGIELQLELDSGVKPVDFSLMKFQQILTNLLKNAIQAQDQAPGPGKKIIVTTREGGNSVLLEVADNAVGIDEEMQEKIFTPGVSTGRTPESMGMGLSIIRRIMESCESTVSAANNAMGGATFTLRFNRQDYILLEVKGPPPPAKDK